jgi:hypothetical protein
MKCSRLCAAAAGALVISAASASADTLLHSFEVLYNDAGQPDPLGTRPDGFRFNGAGTSVTQDTFGATTGTHSMKLSIVTVATFVAALTDLGAPFPALNAPTTYALGIDFTVKEGEQFSGNFANLGFKEFGVNASMIPGDPESPGHSQQYVELPPGTYHLILPLIANFHPYTFDIDVSYASIVDPDPDPNNQMVPTSWELFVNKSSDSTFAGYFDNVQALSSPTSTWKTNSDGNWSDAGQWVGLPTAVPNGVDSIAVFGLPISLQRTVTVDQPVTLGTLYFNNPNGYVLAGSNALTLDRTSGRALINVVSGSHSVSAPLVMNDDVEIIVSQANSLLSLSGAMTATGRQINKFGPGVVEFDTVRAAGLNVNAGTARIDDNAAPNDPAATSVVNNYSIAAGARLDLSNNSMIVDYTAPVGTLVDDTREHLRAGRLASSAGSTALGLGYGDNAVLGKSSFGGQSVDSSSLLIKFTYFGDTDLDGDVDVGDLGTLATSWQTAALWTGGDFDYNGSVDVADLGLLATNWQAGVGSPLAPDFAAALAALGLPSVSVPEPTTACVLALALVPAVPRRRKRRDPK